MLPLLLVIAGCHQSYGIQLKDTTGVVSEGSDPSVSDPVTTDGSWEDATLVINSPRSGDFLPWGEDATFSATVYDAAGNPTDFDDITWSTSLSDAWGLEGHEVVDASLDVGTHDITASAELPNGDRLASTVGGVLVQSPYAGIYSGDITVDVTIDTYTVSCVGAVTLTVDAYGEAAVGDANCQLDLYGYPVDTAYAIDLANNDGLLEGVSTADLYITTYDFSTEGEITEDGVLSGGFTDDVYGYLGVEGVIDATRVTRDLEGG